MPRETTAADAGCVAAARWTVEQCIEESKGEVGLDEYEVRYWHSWHRHITCAMLAHAWLAHIGSQAWGKKDAPELAELTDPEEGRLLDIAMPLPPIDGAPLSWSHWRRAKRLQARRSHYKRRGETLPIVIGYRSCNN